MDRPKPFRLHEQLPRRTKHRHIIHENLVDHAKLVVVAFPQVEAYGEGTAVEIGDTQVLDTDSRLRGKSERNSNEHADGEADGKPHQRGSQPRMIAILSLPLHRGNNRFAPK